MTRRPHAAAPVSALLLLAACAAPGREPGDASPDAGPVVIVVEGFAEPEGVRWDPELDAWYVGNVNGDPGELDGNGYVSLVGASGEPREARHFVGPAGGPPLHAPRGMALAGDTVWVVDALAVHRFHRRTRAWLGAADLSGFDPGFPNDVAVAPDGAAYVTDTGRSRVYRIAGDQVTIALDDPALRGPNGITWDAATGRFLLVPWQPGGGVVAWRPGEETFERVAEAPAGRLDGVERVAGGVLVASQADRTLSWVRGGRLEPAVTLPGAPADIGVDPRRGRVAVPFMALGRVEIRPLP